jgi:arabinose-5-phosphate isomerase
VAEDNALAGIVTDGDLRRHMAANRDLLELTAAHVMTKRPATIDRHCLAVDALRIMEERKITSLVVVGPDDRIEGVVHLHDLWRTQMI